jgi:alpha-mannosidase II
VWFECTDVSLCTLDSGTAKASVVTDYANKLDGGYKAAASVLSDDISHVLFNNQMNLTPLSQRRGPKDLASPTVIPLSTQQTATLVHYNPTGTTRKVLLRARVDTESVCIREGDSLQNVQLNPVVEASPGQLAVGDRFEVVAPLEIPPFGLVVTVLVSEASCAPKKAEVWDSANGNLRSFSSGSLAPAGDEISVSSAGLTATFGSSDGLLRSLRSVTGSGSGGRALMQTKEQVMVYDGQKSHSGAYLFRPQGPARPHAEQAHCVIVRGEFGSDIYTKVSGSVTRVAHLSDYDSVGGASLRVDYLVNLNSGQWTDKDLVVRFETDVDSRGEFYTDLNNFQMDKHVRPPAGGPQCTYFDRPGQDCHPIQSHFFPMVTSAYVQGQAKGAGGTRRFTLHSLAPCATASLRDGWIEAGLDRRLSKDDEKGLMEGVTDNVPTTVSFVLAAEESAARIPPTSDAHPSLLSRRIVEHSNRPVVAMLGSSAGGSGGTAASVGATTTWQQSGTDWPCDVSLESFRPGRTSAQAAGSGALSQAWLYRSSFARGFTPPPGCVPSTAGPGSLQQQYPPVKFEVAQMFSGCAAVSVVPISLGGQATAVAGGTAVQLDSAPEVAAFEFSCTHK